MAHHYWPLLPNHPGLTIPFSVTNRGPVLMTIPFLHLLSPWRINVAFPAPVLIKFESGWMAAVPCPFLCLCSAPATEEASGNQIHRRQVQKGYILFPRSLAFSPWAVVTHAIRKTPGWSSPPLIFSSLKSHLATPASMFRLHHPPDECPPIGHITQNSRSARFEASAHD